MKTFLKQITIYRKISLKTIDNKTENIMGILKFNTRNIKIMLFGFVNLECSLENKGARYGKKATENIFMLFIMYSIHDRSCRTAIETNYK